MIHNHCENDRNNVYFGEWRDTAIFCETNRYHITAFGSAAAVFKLNISVGREVPALRQIKSFKRCRKRSTRTKWRIAEESDAMRGFHLRVASERAKTFEWKRPGMPVPSYFPVSAKKRVAGSSAVWQG